MNLDVGWLACTGKLTRYVYGLSVDTGDRITERTSGHVEATCCHTEESGASYEKFGNYLGDLGEIRREIRREMWVR